jgi:hypothetical protein
LKWRDWEELTGEEEIKTTAVGSIENVAEEEIREESTMEVCFVECLYRQDCADSHH